MPLLPLVMHPLQQLTANLGPNHAIIVTIGHWGGLGGVYVSACTLRMIKVKEVYVQEVILVSD